MDHLAPVWEALSPDVRGAFVARESGAQLRAEELGILWSAPLELGPGRKTLVASSGDLIEARRQGRRVALMEHGCGISYGGDASYFGRVAARSPSYAGGEKRDAEIFLHPGPHPAARDRTRYPGARVEVIGSPLLDTLPGREGDPAVTVAVSFHWDTSVAPEARSTFIYHRSGLASLLPHFRVIGHGHPRIFDRLAPWYERQGIKPVRLFEDVCRQADVYVVDNSSTLFEFASTGRPVVVLNAPYYRKNVDHGGPWAARKTVGPNVDAPHELLPGVRSALSQGASDPLREAALGLVYAYRSGAAGRAAEVLESW